MPDQAIEQTDKELKKLEKEIYKLYSQSADEISAKWYKYMESHEKTLRRTYEDLQIAKKSGDRDAIKEAQEKYERAVKNVTLNNDKYKAMLNETTAKLAHVNEVALSYINNKTPKIYTLNYNEFANQDIDGYTFTLVNENAVRNLIKSDKIELPPKKLDIPKDKRWNAKNINSQLMQGLLQGESIPKIAKRLQNVTDMNERSAVRSARTMVTGAQNKGRQDSFTKATNDGVIMERKWVAAYEPGRTRDWHLELNGVVVGVDEPFENSVGKIMYPGDPSADPSNVYNCRCAIRAIVKGFDWRKNKEDNIIEEFDETKNNQSITKLNATDKKKIEEIKEKIPVVPTNAKELSEKWGIPIKGLRDDVIKNMDDALTYMQNEFGVNPKEYITLIDNKNPDYLRNYQAYYSPWDRGLHVHKERSGGKNASLSPSVCAHEIMHALNGYLSVLETKNHTVHHFEKIADEIVRKVYSENGYAINTRTGLPSKEIIAKTTTKYGSTDSLETLAVSMELTYEKEVMGFKGAREIPRKICDEVKRRLKDDIE